MRGGQIPKSLENGKRHHETITLHFVNWKGCTVNPILKKLAPSLYKTIPGWLKSGIAFLAHLMRQLMQIANHERMPTGELKESSTEDRRAAFKFTPEDGKHLEIKSIAEVLKMHSATT